MSAAATLAGAAPNTAVDWHSINWKKVYRTVRRLQARIVKAVRAGKWHKVKALVYLLTHSCSGRALAVLRVVRRSHLEHAGGQIVGFQHAASARLPTATAPQSLHRQRQRQTTSV